MIDFKSIKLANGLTIISDYNPDTPMATFSIAYKVGSKHENPDKTGLAHLFEHLMFGGSKNVLHYDQQVELSGGNNNAFTTSDYTNYYITLPALNIETAFFLESDRMFYPNLSPDVLEIQRKVVLEEYNQRVLNPPYGDVMSYLLPLVYKSHPYRWPVIGAEIEHIKQIQFDDVIDFHKRFYQPSNAVIAVSGNVHHEKVFKLTEKYFGRITGQRKDKSEIVMESPQIAQQEKVVSKDIPMEMIVMAYHMGPRNSREFYRADLLSDVLSFDKSSRFQQYLRRNDAVFTSLNASLTGNVDCGLFMIRGKLNKGCTIEQGVDLIESQLDKIKKDIEPYEVRKVKNKLITFQKVGYLEHANRAMDLCYADVVHSPSHINKQIEEYEVTTRDEISDFANSLFQPEKRNLLIYKKQNDG